jgi:hypothetical protein
MAYLIVLTALVIAGLELNHRRQPVLRTATTRDRDHERLIDELRAIPDRES